MLNFVVLWLNEPRFKPHEFGEVTETLIGFLTLIRDVRTHRNTFFDQKSVGCASMSFENQNQLKTLSLSCQNELHSNPLKEAYLREFAKIEGLGVPFDE